MKTLKRIFENNRKWIDEVNEKDPTFFDKLAHQQNPEILWIGCSDSRVPANQISGLLPGEMFVHRNVANVVVHTDFNCLSVIQFAVEALKVKHIIVCGHYGCGGVKAALTDNTRGLIDNWLCHIRDIISKHKVELDQYKTDEEKADRLSELNVAEQLQNIAQTTIVKSAWQRGQELYLHGWIYNIADGRLKDLDVSIAE